MPLLSKDDRRAIITEFSATMIFIYVGTMSVVGTGAGFATTPLAAALTFGWTITVLAASIGNLSGGHMNPAVTLSMIVTKNIKKTRAFFYMLAQFAGGVCGAGLTYICAGSRFSGGNGVNMRNPVDQVSAIQAVIFEACFTGLLIFVIFNLSIQDSTDSGSAAIAPLYIGTTVGIAHFCLIPLTGCSINPARSFGAALIQNVWTDQWIFFVGPFLGSFIGPGVFWGVQGTRRPEKLKKKERAGWDMDGHSAPIRVMPDKANKRFEISDAPSTGAANTQSVVLEH